jgi:predicted nucleotidyltransferase component of viral defense system
MYLHEDKPLFKKIIQDVSDSLNILDAVVEKDYYVSLILKEIAASSDKAVFKGGTSLS